MSARGGSLVLTGIGELTTCEAADAPAAREAAGAPGSPAALVVEDGAVAWVGPERSLPSGATGPRVDVAGRAVIPGFVDSHTHLVFGGDRAGEFAARMAGRPYSAGGILSTVEATRAAPADALARVARRLASEARRSGTTTIEVKSGYCLDVAGEARLLEVASQVTTETTFLGAHVVAPEHRGDPDRYVDLVCGEMLSACAPLARWADVFCERGAFDADQATAVLSAAASAGLGLRVHANQLGPGPGVAVAVEAAAASVDHCTHLSSQDIDALAGSQTVATLLPAAEWSTRSPYAQARRLLDAGVTVALASDCNPGTSYTTSMPLVVALAVRESGMTVHEAVLAATAGGAAALRRDDVGRLGPGRRADLVVLEAPSASWLAYRPGVALVAAVARGGELVAGAWPGGPL